MCVCVCACANTMHVCMRVRYVLRANASVLQTAQGGNVYRAAREDNVRDGATGNFRLTIRVPEGRRCRSVASSAVAETSRGEHAKTLRNRAPDRASVARTNREHASAARALDAECGRPSFTFTRLYPRRVSFSDDADFS